jgi:hypothetical protein
MTPAVVTVNGHANWRCCPAGIGKLGLGDPVATTADPPKFTKQKSFPALSTTTVSPPAGSATSCEVVVAATDTHPLGLNDWICPVIGSSYCCVIRVDATISTSFLQRLCTVGNGTQMRPVRFQLWQRAVQLAERIVGAADQLQQRGRQGPAEWCALCEWGVRRSTEYGSNPVQHGETQCASHSGDVDCNGECGYPAAVLAEAISGGAQGYVVGPDHGESTSALVTLSSR